MMVRDMSMEYDPAIFYFRSIFFRCGRRLHITINLLTRATMANIYAPDHPAHGYIVNIQGYAALEKVWTWGAE